MSFQGDVAGIGLGELLQGLARGGRDGVLTLRAGVLGATVGLSGGQLFLLPEPDEDPEVWRKRCERAWVVDPSQRIDILRMTEIAFAERMEMMFRLLDSEGVHFRFEPGPLPQPGELAAAGASSEAQLPRADSGARVELRVPVHCQGISVEFMLLEYARLSDECRSYEQGPFLSLHDVPRVLMADPPTEGLRRFWEQADGMSNVLEIADRLGWPARQAMAVIQALMAQELLRLADARELLALAQREISQNRFARAASRLSCWCLGSPPGPPLFEEGELLLQEWQRGKLAVVLASMEPRLARRLLRRLDHAEPAPSAAAQRWAEQCKYHRHDAVSDLRLLHWQLRSQNEADLPAAGEFLRLARKFQEADRLWRCGVVLRAAAARLPESTATRLEIGTRMLAAGLVDEGAHWVLEGCRALIEAKQPEKALAPLRSVLEADPHSREARNLFTFARSQTASGRRGRRNSVLVLCATIVMGCIAIVRVRSDSARERLLDEIEALAAEPEKALVQLDLRFGKDETSRVRALRADLTGRLEAAEMVLREQWLQGFQACQLEIEQGDPVLGLKSTLELPPHPALPHLTEAWPSHNELLNALATRLELTVSAWGSPELIEGEELHQEQRLHTLVGDLERLIEGGAESGWVDSFRTRIEVLRSSLAARDELRARYRAQRDQRERVQEQDRLLHAAREHAKAGDLERSVENYRKLLATPGAELVAQLLAKEVTEVEAHHAAWRKAIDLSRQGRHAEAREALESACDNLREHLMPWKVESRPAGARARLSDGTVRAAPFVVESAFGERIELTFELGGHQSAHLLVDEPGDRLVRLSRLPQRRWQAAGVVEALPVGVGEDHIVADRAGRVVRLGRGDEQRWSVELKSLGGLARAPVFLPRRPGAMLLVTEDGDAWILDSDDGAVEGPWKAASPPIDGPAATAGGVRASFRDGRTVEWEAGLRPERSEQSLAQPELRSDPSGSDAGLSVLRRKGSSERTLSSPWGPWSVEVLQGEYVVRLDGSEEQGFNVERIGDWIYVAWEAPHAKLPQGRLWVSDGGGLRAFEP